MNTESKQPREESKKPPLKLRNDPAEADQAPWTGEERRRHPRVKFHRVVTIRIPDGQTDAGTGGPKEHQVNARTFSNGGVSFVSDAKFEQKDVQVALDLSDGSTLWFDAEIVRTRPLDDGSGWEFGAAFRGITNFEA